MPEYRSPSFLKPRTYEEIPQSIDALFNAYQKSRQQSFGEASQAFGLQSQLAGQGIDPSGYDPNNPGAFFEPLLQEARAKKTKATEVQTAELAKTQAETAAANALAAQRNTFASMGSAGGLGLETDPRSGLQFLPASRPGGQPQIIPGQSLSSEVMVKKTFADDALSNLNEIEEALKMPNAREMIIKTGGSLQRLKSLGDPVAEKLANAILQAGDNEGRFRSGAAFREGEEEMYLRRLLDPTGTTEGNLDRVRRKKEFFNKALKNMAQGRPMPGGQQGDPIRRNARINGQIVPMVSTDGGKTFKRE